MIRLTSMRTWICCCAASPPPWRIRRRHREAGSRPRPRRCNDLMNHNDGLNRMMTRDQWLEIMRSYRDGELNQGIEP